jgi:cytochrome c heme-lyase
MAAQDSHSTGTEDAPKCPVDHSAFKHFLPKSGAGASDHPQLPEGHPPVLGTTPEGEAAKCPVSPEAHKHFLPRSTQSAGSPSIAVGTGTEAGSGVGRVGAAGNEGLKINPTNNMPATPDQFRTVTQRGTLNTEREISSIPKSSNSADPYASSSSSSPASSSSGTHAPDPDGDHEKVWIYPSEQMFFNAMKRKNWNPREEDMKFVVPIHNMVNEMAWKHILRWEKLAQK